MRSARGLECWNNTEPWQFRVQDSRIDVLLDFSRWLNVADDDQRELHTPRNPLGEVLV